MFNGTSVLESELKEVLELSRRQLASNGDGKQLSDLLGTSGSDGDEALLGAAERVAEAQPVLPVLARRIAFARRLLHFIERGSSALGDQEEQQLPALAKGFYSLHVAGVVRRGLLEYLHISKSGGTSFSHAAKANGCDMEGGMGQLEELGDLPRWVNASAFREATGAPQVMWDAYGEVERRTTARTCEARKEHVRARGHNYVSNEYTLHGGLGDMGRTHVCPQMVNVVTLRHPLRRLESHLHYMLSFMSRSVKRQTKDGAAFARAFCSGRPGVWERVAPAVADNYNVRSFVGEAAFHSPVGAIGRPHLERARSLLVQFDLVLDLDAGQDASALLMSQGLGWGTTLSEVRARTSQRVTSKHGFDQAADCPREGLAELLPRQQPDMQLYSTGRTISLLDRLVLAAAAAAGSQPYAVAAEVEAAMDAAEGGGGGGGSRGTLLSSSSAAQQQQRSISAADVSCGLLGYLEGPAPRPPLMSDDYEEERAERKKEEEEEGEGEEEEGEGQEEEGKEREEEEEGEEKAGEKEEAEVEEEEEAEADEEEEGDAVEEEEEEADEEEEEEEVEEEVEEASDEGEEEASPKLAKWDGEALSEEGDGDGDGGQAEDAELHRAQLRRLVGGRKAMIF